MKAGKVVLLFLVIFLFRGYAFATPYVSGVFNISEWQGYHTNLLEGSFDPALLSSYTCDDITTQWTMGRGNDYIAHTSAPASVPEPSSMLAPSMIGSSPSTFL